MNKILLILFSFVCSNSLAQDVIVKKDGSTILSKVLEVNTSEIKYKKYSNLDGPTYTILKTELLSINYKNGEKDMFDVTATTQEAKLTEALADKRNVELLTSSSCHPKIFVKEFSYFLMPCHQHGLGVNLLVQR